MGADKGGSIVHVGTNNADRDWQSKLKVDKTIAVPIQDKETQDLNV